MITPNEEGRNNNRVIIPYTFENKIVGHISRYLDDRIPKYIKEQQLGYVFGYDLQKPDYEVCIVVEGVLDALSINGCALTHDTISDEQAELLRGLNRRIIIVPDFDKSGLSIIERALELGFEVSLPNWANDIKDTNDAVLKYGKLPTLISILRAATNSKIKIEMQRTKIAKRI
jgi:DNA primase